MGRLIDWLDTGKQGNTFRYTKFSEKKTVLGKTMAGVSNLVKGVLNFPTNGWRTGLFLFVKGVSNNVRSIVNPIRGNSSFDDE
jgi:hypothetical protein